ncbi:hypothetical protein METHP14_10096 [Pseudomonas sp. P14-2025]
MPCPIINRLLSGAFALEALYHGGLSDNGSKKIIRFFFHSLLVMSGIYRLHPLEQTLS